MEIAILARYNFLLICFPVFKLKPYIVNICSFNESRAILATSISTKFDLLGYVLSALIRTIVVTD